MEKEGRLLREVKHFAQVKRDKAEHKDSMMYGLTKEGRLTCSIKNRVQSAQEILDVC